MCRVLTLSLMTVLSWLCIVSISFADYQLTKLASSEWSGTNADRLLAETAGSYHFDYGEEATVNYTLPWSFSFYRIVYNQITADSDGNIWFGTVGNSPKIAAWNADLSSYFFGGVFVEYKSNPDRVVIEWLAETFLDQGLNRPNNFEVVLYPDGKIQLNYRTFTMAQGQDAGSGISNNDGVNFINLTATYGEVSTLGGQSFVIEEASQTPNALLDVSFAGNGDGSIVSTPAGIDCQSNCSAQFPVGTEISLSASAVTDSSFTGWSDGPCSGTGDCVLTLDVDTAITANFTIINIPFDVILESTQQGYFSIQGAYDSILGTAETIKL